MDKSLGLLLLENEMEYIGIQERLILNMRVKKKREKQTDRNKEMWVSIYS